MLCVQRVAEGCPRSGQSLVLPMFVLKTMRNVSIVVFAESHFYCFLHVGQASAPFVESEVIGFMDAP